MGEILDGLFDAVYEVFFKSEDERRRRLNKSKKKSKGKITTNTGQDIIYTFVNNAANAVAESVQKSVQEVLPAIVENINDTDGVEVSEYVTYEGDVSDYPAERLELDTNYPIIRLSETPEGDNIFASSIFRFRNNGPRYGCDVRLEPYYKIPMRFYEDKWGEEILTFTDVLAGYIPLVEKARIVARDPKLYFGIKIYNNPDSFMLSSLDARDKMTDDILITVDTNKYEISWKRDLNGKINK